MAQPPLFLDTAYIHALFNSRDQWHSKAVEWQKMLEIDNRRLVTTQLILVEIGNGLSSRQFRQKAASIIRNLQEDPIVDVIPVTPAAFSLALELFEQRPDKDWGLHGLFFFCRNA